MIYFGICCGFLALAMANRNLSFVPCNLPHVKPETRRLFVLTCETRPKTLAYQAWQMTGDRLRSTGVDFKNVCEGSKWFGTATKPVAYFHHVQEIMHIFDNNTMNYVLLTDSDTFWSVSHIEDVWHNFDCARGTKEMVVSTEMTCWLGRQCSPEQYDKYYSEPHVSYSPFVNSGVIMGQIDLVRDLWNYTLINNASFQQMWGNRTELDDQFAVTDFARFYAPDKVAVDYHQQLAGSFSIITTTGRDSRGSSCVGRDGNLTYKCHAETGVMIDAGHFAHDNVTCEVYRKVWQGMPHQLEMESLAARPVLWHGNGRGKGLYEDYSRFMIKCLKERDTGMAMSRRHQSHRIVREKKQLRERESITHEPNNHDIMSLLEVLFGSTVMPKIEMRPIPRNATVPE